MNTLEQTGILEICEIRDVFPHISKDSLLILDIDDTIITSTSYIGSQQWINDLIKKFSYEGLSPYDAIQKAFKPWREAQKRIPIKLTEDNIPSLFEYSENIMGCTARSGFMMPTTIKQLKSVGLSFAQEDPVAAIEEFLEAHFSQGVLFCNGKPKEQFLLPFLQHYYNNAMPSQIIMVDDGLQHLEGIQKSCQEYNVDFLGFLYSRCKEQFPRGSVDNLSTNCLKALKTIYDLLSESTIEWYITGTTNLALHAIPVTPSRLGLLIHNYNLEKFLDLFQGYSRSDIITLDNEEAQEFSISINNAEVMVCAEYDHSTYWQGGSVSDSLVVDAMPIPCLTLAAEYKAYTDLGMHDKAALIKGFMP